MPDKQKVVFISFYYPPDVEATGRLLEELLQALQSRGIPCEIWTRKNPARFRTGIPIREIWTPLLRKQNIFLRTLVDLWFSFRILLVLIMEEVPSRMVLTTNPHYLPLLGGFFKKKNNRIFLLIYDIYPEVAVELGKIRPKSLFYNGYLGLRNRAYQAAEQIITFSRDMADTIRNLDITNSMNGKIQVIPNWAEHFWETRKPFPRTVKTGPIQIVYSGNIGYSQDFHSLISIAQRASGRWSIRVVGGGATYPFLKEMIRTNKILNINLSTYLNQKDFVDLLEYSDMGLILLKAGVYRYSMPSKLYSYLGAGLPVAAMVEDGSFLASILDTYRCGFSIPPGDVESLVSRIEYFESHRKEFIEMGIRARECYYEIGKRSSSISQYFQLFGKDE